MPRSPWSSEPCQGRGREGYGNASEFDGEALEPRVEHPFRDDMPDAAGDDVEQAFADEVLADDEGDFADGDAGVAVRWSSVLPDDGPEVPALLFGEECGVQLGDDGVAAVGVRRSEARRSAGTSLMACSSSDGEMYATNFS